MLKSLTKAVAYWKAPVKTFVVLHPMRALKWGGIVLIAKVLLDRGKARRAGEA